MKRVLTMAIAVLLVSFTAHAADWNFYGSARISTFYEKVDDNMWVGLQDTKDYQQKLHGNSRIGARVKVNDKVSGRFEYGAVGGSANIRLLYGEWNFGAGKLIVGQSYTPLLSVTNQAYNSGRLNLGDTNGAYWGAMYAGRKAQIGIKVGRLYVAAVEQEAELYDTSSGTKEVKLPELHANYTFAGETWFAQLMGGLAGFDVKEGANSDDVTSYLLGAHGRIKMGRAYITGGGWFGENAGNLIQQYVSFNPNNSGTFMANWDGTRINDNEGAGYFVSAGYVFNEMVKFEAGYGYCQSELDTAGATKYDATNAYIQCTITLAPGVTVVPEIGRIDMSDGPVVGNMDTRYYGMKWQINF